MTAATEIEKRAVIASVRELGYSKSCPVWVLTVPTFEHEEVGKT
jgi:hypothetical protein